VISAEMDGVAQMQPNNQARFVQVDMETALKARTEYESRIARLSASLKA
jgi:allophanate hydrolase subunit 2